MTVSTDTIDRIVANVLSQLSGVPGVLRAPQAKLSRPTTGSVSISERVVTAGLLEEVPCQAVAIVASNAIVTPAALDLARQRSIRIERVGTAAATGNSPILVATKPDAGSSKRTSRGLMIIVRNTDALDRLWDDLSSSMSRELVGCADDAASLAISAICRGDAAHVVVCAEEIHRTACLANRNERVKAAIVNELGDIKAVRQQLRANIWCLDPSSRSYFELKKLFHEISTHS
jgi:hypothetical protein